MSEINVSQAVHDSVRSIERTARMLETAKGADPAAPPSRDPAVIVDVRAAPADATDEHHAAALDTERANLLALQMRQQIGSRATAFAGPAEQAILDLFRG